MCPQSIKQKASATVQGLASFIIALAILIGVVLWGLAKPLSSGAAKIVIGFVMVILLFALAAWAYTSKAPPFFAPYNKCINGSSIGNDGTSNCINQKPGNINIKQAPLKYKYGITPSDQSEPGGNLVQMSIAAMSSQTPATGGGNNGGYRVDTYNNLENELKKYDKYAVQVNVPPIPNPLVPYPNSKGFYEIPAEYIQGGKGMGGICTPGVLQLADGALGYLRKCNSVIDPVVNSLKTTTNPSLAIANLNTKEWSSYLNPTHGDILNRRLFARFVLNDIIAGSNMDMHIYVNEDEMVRYQGANGQVTYDQAKNVPNKNNIYKFVAHGAPNWQTGTSSSGVLQGQVGVYNTRSYKLQKFMRKIGIWIILSIVILIILYMMYTSFKKTGKKTEK